MVKPMLTRLEREQLLRRWEEADAELKALAELPVGSFDPSERERRLLELQDVIECLFLWHFREQEALELAGQPMLNPASR